MAILHTASLHQETREKPMSLRFLTPDCAEWDQFLGSVRHDFYHRAAYARLMAHYDGGQPEAVLVCEADCYFFLPYIVRPLSHIPWLGAEGSMLFDIVSPYGYPGPLSSGDDAFNRKAIDEWQQLMRQRGCVSGFVRLHPLLNTAVDVLTASGQLVERGRTVSIDLRLPLEEMWSQTRADHRRNISKSRRMGITAAIEDFHDNLDTFLQMYNETMDRTRASTYYYFPKEYFHSLKEALGDGLSLCLVRDVNGDILSGTLLTECCGIVQYHLSGTFDAAIPLRPSKLMLDYAHVGQGAWEPRLSLGGWLRREGGLGLRVQSRFFVGPPLVFHVAIHFFDGPVYASRRAPPWTRHRGPKRRILPGLSQLIHIANRAP